MPLLEWQPKFSVDVPEMDAQHQKLIGMINALHEAMSSGHGNDALGQVLDAMVAYTQVHFRAEERLLAEAAYPGLAGQKEAHGIFVEEVTALRADHHAGRAALSMKTMQFLKDWLTAHIMAEDKRYGVFLAERAA